MEILNYIYNKVYAPVEDDFGFDDAGDMDELDDELQMETGGASSASDEGGDELYEHWKVQVDANQDPVRIDKYLADKMAYQSRNRIQQAADAGFIHVNGKPVKSNYKVRPNDLVTLMLDRPRHETSIKPEEIAINVVYEDDQLMVVNKEAGMVVHPGAGNFHGTLIQAVAWHLRDMPEFDANDPEVGLVHRIDKDTSGLLVVAKTPTAKTALGKQFFNKTTHRSYNALVWGNIVEDEGRIEGNIGRDPKNRLRMKVFDPDSGIGKTAVTHYKVLERFGYTTLVHRIDKDTSGLLVVAKTPTAKTALGKQFFNKTTHRRYNALVWGNMVEDEGRIEGNIGRDPKNRLRMKVFDPDSGIGKTAVTHYKVLERFGYTTLVQCVLETGRTHQIRAHMKHIGHPLFMDETYGGTEILRGQRSSSYKAFIQNCFKLCPRQALHAKTLGFVHPTTKQQMDFDSEWPNDFRQLIEKWRGFIAGTTQDTFKNI